MSIKQNGGVFGRNPTFNDVTIEGQLTFDGDIDINSDLKVDGDLDVTGNLGVGTDAGSDIIEISDAAPIIKATATNGASGLRINVIGDSSNTLRLQSNGASKLEVNGNNLKLNSGSLQLATAGQGIDFSATAGTGTSELLSDYEEGAWTPELRFGGATPSGIVQASSLGYYTKVGNLVTVQLKIILSSKGAQTGNAEIYGLPFAAGASGDAGAYPSFFNNLNLTASQVPIGKASGSDIELRYPIAGVAQRMNHSHITDTTDIRMFSSYYI